MKPPDWSDQVTVSHQAVLASWRELLCPVDDGRLDEAAAAQPEEGGQVPQHAQTAVRNKQTTTTMATKKSGQQSKT